MAWLVTKYLITALIVVAVSEVAKHSDRLGAMIAALPIVTLLTLIWLYAEGQPTSKISNHAFYTFWYVIPTLPMFLAFPYLQAKIGFWLSLLACIALTAACFTMLLLFMRRFGVNLL
ncbi:MAG: DUF3147 family protein [Pseudomonadales bacterium]